MALNWFRKLFDTNEKELRQISETVKIINSLEDKYKKYSNEDLKLVTEQFRERMRNGETLDDLLPDSFASCREAGRRTLNMRHFDVQLMGGIILHQGRIAEMRTGEGKTLVATLPLCLNAIEGKGVHLVTVNDYLARRDAVWMGPIFHALGLSVGIIQGQSADSDEAGGSYIYTPGYEAADPRYMHCKPCTRKEAYQCDVTYGTNHEFGFDYLRDNMAYSLDEISQRELNYAIIDEVDSILIDEARTPHIISGAVKEDVSRYKRTDQIVRRLKKDQDFKVDEKAHSVVLTEEGSERVEQLLGIENLAEDPEEMHYVNACLKAYGLYHKDKEYVVKDGEIIIVDEFTGRLMFGRRFSDGLHQAIEAKEGVPIRQENQTIAVITFQNLFRLYKKLAGMTGTAKTEEDEFRKIYGLDVFTIPTNKPMIRIDNQDRVYKTEEAKFRGITFELLRLYAKQQPVLVGTRSIDMSEKLSKRLNFDKLQAVCAAKKLLEVLETGKGKEKKAEYRAILLKRYDQLSMGQMQQIARELGVNLKMTDPENIAWLRKSFELTEEADEYLDEALKHGIPHNILNAKFHEKEALIIAEAGVKGRVTIATNMAGRGVDILLGGTILPEDLRQQREELEKMEAAAEQTSLGDTSNPFLAGEMKEDNEQRFDDTYVSFRRGGRQRAAPPMPLDQQQRSAAAEEVRKLGGLFIMGTERHESRRIDNQLRGRGGRQGDPGESVFFVSMEDELMRLFGDNTRNNPLLKTWADEEPIAMKLISRMIEKAQKRIEFQNFQSRKHVLEYDDVLNVQRELIYKQRKQVLTQEADLESIIMTYTKELVDERVNIYCPAGAPNTEWDIQGLFQDIHRFIPITLELNQQEIMAVKQQDELITQLMASAERIMNKRIDEYGSEAIFSMLQHVILRSTNTKWMEHLAQMDYLREGIHLRGYAQMDPLIAYKKEAYEIFKDTMMNIRNETLLFAFYATIGKQERTSRSMTPITDNDGDNGKPKVNLTSGESRGGTKQDVKIGRNDPCWCGSGLKYKKCHGK